MWKHRIVGQEIIQDRLLKSLVQNHLSHAIIMSGTTGRGGLVLGLTLAQNLLCNTPNRVEACGTCKSCTQVTQLVHPDLHMAYPVVAKEGMVRKNVTSATYISEWRRALSQNPYLSLQDWVQEISTKRSQPDINTTECNHITQTLSMQAFVGDHKVQLIWMSQYLGKNANKLLKLIEEPPPGTHFILLCDHHDQLLKTVVSRCQVIEIPRITDHSIQEHLENKFQVSVEQSRQAAFLAEGDFRIAMDAGVGGSKDLLALSLEWLRSCRSHDYNLIRNWSEEFARHKPEDQQSLVQFTLRLLRELLHLNVLGRDFCKLAPRDIDELLSVPGVSDLKSREIEKIHFAVGELLDGIARNISPRLMMFETCLQMDNVMADRIRVVRT